MRANGLFLGAFVASSLVAAFPASNSVALELELINHPSPERAALYAKQADEVERLRAEIGIAGAPAKARLTALESLNLRFPEAAVSTSGGLLSDDSAAVASAASDILATSIVMSDHSPVDHAVLSPLQRYVGEQHAAARSALREGLMSKHPEVREIAATTLASLSDEEALGIIDRGVSSGEYTQGQAVNIYGLADPDLGANFILPYLQSDSETAQAAAAGYLGANRSYQQLVRDSILLNPDAGEVSRVAAANILSQYDPAFTSYALTIAKEVDTPPDVFLSVVKGYVGQLNRTDQSVASVIAVEEAIEDYSVQLPNADLLELNSQLELLLGE